MQEEDQEPAFRAHLLVLEVSKQQQTTVHPSFHPSINPIQSDLYIYRWKPPGWFTVDMKSHQVLDKLG